MSSSGPPSFVDQALSASLYQYPRTLVSPGAGFCIAKATMLETIATIQKAMIIHEEGRTVRRPRVLTDERG
jgi:hypothetical protein